MALTRKVIARGLAIELVPHNITANAIASDSIDTICGPSADGPTGRSHVGDLPHARRRPEGRRDGALSGRPEGHYITRQTIHVNGRLFLGK
jgi:NAD(P)-dependent dehydrogenase (short-subunit alcohol dehydrogenase family)